MPQLLARPLLERLGLDAFMAGLLAAVALAWAVPSLGRTHGILHIDLFTSYGIALVFLLYGLTLPLDRLKAGLMNWRLHLLVQSSTFLLFPALVPLFTKALGSHLSPELRLGFFYLAALPSTISSSVAMTSIARGNVAGAIFNASLSSLIGVFATPLWVHWYLRINGQAMPLGDVLLKVALLVLAPIVLGQALRPLLYRWVAKHQTALKRLDRATILAIVFNSFSDSMVEGVWRGKGLQVVGTIAGLSIVLFFLVFFLMAAASHLLGFNREDSIAGMFCGTKKSLATGVPLAKVMFGPSPALGLIIAPVMLYHFLQLILASVIARRFAAREG